jgi:hypothetical protein
MYPYLVQTASLLIITLLYAAFDLFNKRNVPDIFAYASVITGVVITFAYNTEFLGLSLGLALFVGMLSYLIYRAGLWGAGDGFELVAISLIFPLQPIPIIQLVPQLGLPFILSVFIATGFVSVLIVPLYYMGFVKRPNIKLRGPSLKRVMLGIVLMGLYLLLFIFISYSYTFSLMNLILLLFIAVPSAITMIFEEEITSKMVKRMVPKQLEEGDIIAFNMMSKGELKYFSSRYPGFERLATKRMLRMLNKEKKELPVYKNAAPLAVFICIGVVISMFVGNVILLIV